MSLHKTRGIVLHQVNFSETSVIVKIYTETFGLQTYIIRGVRKRKHNVSPGLLQHLSLIELEVYHKETSEIQNIKEIRSAFPFSGIPFNILKSSIGLFINEVILKSLKEGDPNPDLFEFLFTSIQMFDLTTEKIIDFHLWFCIQLTKFLGFFPRDDHSESKCYFDLLEGHYVSILPNHPHFLDKNDSKALRRLSFSSFENLKELQITGLQRKDLIKKILEYYSLHLQGFREVHSHLILEKVLEL